MHTPKKKKQKNVTHKRHQLYFSINVQRFFFILIEKKENKYCVKNQVIELHRRDYLIQIHIVDLIHDDYNVKDLYVFFH
jgi:hypothetical protein